MKTHVFDYIAKDYDDDFTHSPVTQHLRTRVHTRLLEYFAEDSRVLELGCGTGFDAAFLSDQGIQVTACDASPAMLDIARQRSRPGMICHLLDLNQLQENDFFNEQFDGAFSNFGPLNCVEELSDLAQWLAVRIRPGGVLVFVVMGSACTWEFIWHGLHGDWHTATRRQRGSSFQPKLEAEPITIFYPSPRTLARAFEPYFKRIRQRPLGLLLPPTELYPGLERRPRLLRALYQADSTLCRIGSLANFADHYIIELRRSAW